MAHNKVNQNKKPQTKNKRISKRKNYTENQKQFLKYQKRINKWQKDLQKKGFEFTSDVVSQELPKRVTKKQLEKLSKLTKKDMYKYSEYMVTEEQDSYSDNYAYGEVISGDEARKLIRQIGAKKGWEKRRRKQIAQQDISKPINNNIIHPNFIGGDVGDDYQKSYQTYNDIYEQQYTNSANVIVNNFKEKLKSYPRNLTSPLVNLTNELIKKSSVRDFAYMLQNLPDSFNEVLGRHVHDSSGAIEEFATQMIEYLPNLSDGMREELMDKFEYHEIGYEIDDED